MKVTDEMKGRIIIREVDNPSGYRVSFMNKNYTVHKYCKEWAIYDPVSECYVLFGRYKRALQLTADRLNREAKK